MEASLSNSSPSSLLPSLPSASPHLLEPFSLLEAGSHYIAQAGLDHMVLSDCPVLAYWVVIKGMCHSTQLSPFF